MFAESQGRGRSSAGETRIRERMVSLAPAVEIAEYTINNQMELIFRRYLPEKAGYSRDFLLYLEHYYIAGSGTGHPQGIAGDGYLAWRPGGFL